ncbi:hypothetical protein DPEC_G00347590 [Dallia pectoralis]|uniref:Uncharacterized protein n=1 Tax=Dallia pectoralis TaxID=75939 RepID=A0ACC2F444_DALPE|nr:hypothetical protein DPEC_G00347590 [Dallia pectoralis]
MSSKIPDAVQAEPHGCPQDQTGSSLSSLTGDQTTHTWKTPPQRPANRSRSWDASLQRESHQKMVGTLENACTVDNGEDKWYGKVIYNITVTVQDNRELNNTNQTTPDNLIMLYVVRGLLLCCLFLTCVVMWKKTKNSQAKHQTLKMNRNQDVEETRDL